MDAAQSGRALGIGRVLDVLGPFENSFSLSWRRKITKCQLLRVSGSCNQEQGEERAEKRVTALPNVVHGLEKADVERKKSL